MTNEEAIKYFRQQIKLIESKPRYYCNDLNDIKQCDEDDYYIYHAAQLAIAALGDDNNRQE